MTLHCTKEPLPPIHDDCTLGNHDVIFDLKMSLRYASTQHAELHSATRDKFIGRLGPTFYIIDLCIELHPHSFL